MADDEDVISYGDYSTLTNIQKELTGVSLRDIGTALGFNTDGRPPRTEEDLKITKKDIQGFVKRRKKAAEKQKKAGMFSLTKQILDEQYSPRISLDYQEVLPILPGLYRQSKTAIKDKLIDEQINIAQQKEKHKAALSNTPPPDFGIMSPRELANSLEKTNFEPLIPKGMVKGHIASLPDKPTDPSNLPFFSFTGPSEYAPTAGGVLRFFGPAQFTNPLTKPKDALGSGFGFSLKGLAGKSEEFLTKELITNIKKNSSKEGSSVFDTILTESGVFVDDLPVNKASIKKEIEAGSSKKFLQLKDLRVADSLEDLKIKETDGARNHEHVQYNMDIFNNQSAYDVLNRNEDNVGSFAITDSIKGVGLTAKGVPTPYSTKSYEHLEVVTDIIRKDPEVGSVLAEPLAALYGHKRLFLKKEVPEGFPSIEEGPKIVDNMFQLMKSKNPGQFVSNSTPAGLRDVPYSDVTIDGNPLDIHKHYIYNNISEAKNKGMIPPADKVILQRIGAPPLTDDRSVFDTSGKLNNYDSDIIIEEFPKELFETEDFTFRQLLYREGPEWRPFDPKVDIKAGSYNNDGQLVTTNNEKLRSESIDKQRQFTTYKDFLDFKVEMQKLDALLKLVKVPNIVGSKVTSTERLDRMTIQDVVKFFDETAIEKDAKGPGGMLINGQHAFLTDYIRTYAKTAIHNSFNREPIEVRQELMDNIAFSLDTIASENWTDKYLSRIDPGIYPHTTTTAREFLNPDLKEYRYGNPITVKDLKKYIDRIAKIQYQKAIIDNPPPVEPVGRRKPGMDPKLDLRFLEEGKGEFYDAINIKPEMFEVLDKWEELRGQRHVQIHHIPEDSAFLGFAEKRTGLLQDIEYKWGPGKVREYIVEEQFDTFKKKAFSSPQDILAGMYFTKVDIAKGMDKALEDDFAKFLQGKPVDDPIPPVPPVTAAEAAFAYFQKHPESLVELTTVHNIKQALENTNLDAIRFNTFATSTKFQGWGNDLTQADKFKLLLDHLKNAPEDVKSLARQLYDPNGPMHKGEAAAKIFNAKDLRVAGGLSAQRGEGSNVSTNLAGSLEIAADNMLVSEAVLQRPSVGDVATLKEYKALIQLEKDGIGIEYFSYLPEFTFPKTSPPPSSSDASKALIKIKKQAKWMTLGGLTPKPIQQFRVYQKMRALRLRMFQVLENEFKALEFGATNDTPILRRLLRRIYSRVPTLDDVGRPVTRADFDELTFSLGMSPEANAFIMSYKDSIENFGSTMMGFMNMRDSLRPIPLLQALNMLNFNLNSMLTFYNSAENANPFFSPPFGLISDEVLTNAVRNAKSFDSDTAKLTHMAFSNQYDKYKISALDKLGLNYKIVNEFTNAEYLQSSANDRNLTFYEVELPRDANKRKELLDKINDYEIKLFSQYMPFPSFEQKNEEEMGAT